MSEKNRKAIILYLVFVLGYSYLFGVLELIFKNGVFYDFLGKSFTFVPVITALVLNKKVAKNTGGYMSLKVWKNPRALAASAFAPGILISMGAVLYFLVFPNEYSGVFAMGNLYETGENKAISNPLLFVLICIFISAVFFPIHLLELGEEVGWRGYLLWKQKEIYGEPKAVIINGIEWGIAHLPLIYFGFNYSLDNLGAPWTKYAADVVVMRCDWNFILLCNAENRKLYVCGDNARSNKYNR